MEPIRIENAHDFGNAVRTARKAAGLSQAQLAQTCGCSQRLVSEIERGKKSAELGKALKLLDALGIPLIAGTHREAINGRAEVNYALVRIASELDRAPRKRRRLADHLSGADDE